MKLLRRQFLRLAAGVAALPAVSRIARAQGYPARPVRIIVGYPPGGGTDILARLMAQWLSERLNQAFVVENRPGAGANIATEMVVRAPADGYTLLMAGSFNASNATLYDKLNFNFIRDIAPVAGVMRTANVIVVQPSFPAKTIPEFIAHAKANPGRVSTASPGIGTASHMSGELFKMMTGVNMVHVPYRGSAPMVADLLSGHVQVAFDVMTASLPHIRSGALRALAVAGKTRFAGLPDVPTVSDVVPGFEASAWQGVGVPRGTPNEIIERLNREINDGLVNPVIKARLADAATTPMVFTPAEFGAYMAAETEKWGKVVKFTGIKPE